MTRITQARICRTDTAGIFWARLSSDSEAVADLEGPDWLPQKSIGMATEIDTTTIHRISSVVILVTKSQQQ